MKLGRMVEYNVQDEFNILQFAVDAWVNPLDELLYKFLHDRKISWKNFISKVFIKCGQKSTFMQNGGKTLHGLFFLLSQG